MKGLFEGKRGVVLIIGFIAFGVAIYVILGLLTDLEKTKRAKEGLEIFKFTQDAAWLCDPAQTEPELRVSGEFNLAKNRHIEFEGNKIISVERVGNDVKKKSEPMGDCKLIDSNANPIEPGVIQYEMELDYGSGEKHLIITVS